MDSGILIAGLIFVLVILLGFLAFHYSDLSRIKKDVKERIEKEAAPQNLESPSAVRQPPGFLLRTTKRLAGFAQPKEEADLTRTKKRLVRAGYYGENDQVIFHGSKVFMAFFFAAISVILKFSVLKAMPAQHFLVLIILFTAAGFYLPDLYLHQRTQDRKRKIFDGFPDALDLMVVCVEAGMGLDAAIKRVGDEMALKSKELGEEFKILSLELRMGKPRVVALRNLAVRTDIEDISGLVTLLIQTDKFGTRVAQALRVHSDAMRTKRYLRAEEIASKLPVKMVIPLIFFIFPSIFVTIIGPAVIQIYRNFLSH